MGVQRIIIPIPVYFKSGQRHRILAALHVLFRDSNLGGSILFLIGNCDHCTFASTEYTKVAMFLIPVFRALGWARSPKLFSVETAIIENVCSVGCVIV